MNTLFLGNNPKSTRQLLDWHGRAVREAAIDPRMPIVDAHHHLYGQPGDERYYRLQDLTSDLSGGHAVIGTVYVEGYESGWHESGPPALRPVGEVEMIVARTRVQPALAHGPCRVGAGIVAYADLTLGDAVEPVLEALLAASQGRLRGVRPLLAWADGTVGSTLLRTAPRDLMADAQFRRGVACVQRLGLSLDAWIYHPQLSDLAGLADAFPDLPIVIDHVGGLIGVAEARRRHAVSYAQWLRDMQRLAARPNVWVKVGGLGMPVFGFGFEHEPRPATSVELAHAWQPLVDGCIEAFGPARCLFETNSPVDKQSGGYVQLWNAYKRCVRELAEDERRALCYRSACTVYRLPELKAVGDAMAVCT